MTPATDSNPGATEAVPLSAIVALSCAAFGSGISLRVTDPLLPRLASDFGVSLGSASYVITCFAVAYGTAQLFFGPVGDRFGKYLVIAWACVASVFAALLCALAPSFTTLLMARLVAGAMAAAVIPLSMAWIGDVVPYDQRQPVLARFLIGQIFGLSCGVFIGGFAADHASWRLPFFLAAVLFAVISLVLFSANRRLPAYARVVRKAEGHAVTRMVTDFSYVLSRPWARVVLGTVFLEGAFLYGAFAFIASHLHRVYHLSLSTAGALLVLFGAGGFLYALGSRILSTRLGESGLIFGGALILLASLLMTGLAPVWWWAIPGCFFTGLGFYMLHNTLQMNATQMAPERRGVAVSAFASCFFMGQSVGVGLAGMLVERSGTAAVIVIGAVGVCVVGLNFWRLQRPARRHLREVS
jgi:predicted MFS family arabinose efflux permease